MTGLAQILIVLLTTSRIRLNASSAKNHDLKEWVSFKFANRIIFIEICSCVQGAPKRETRPGDWDCPSDGCTANNFSNKTECYKCSEPRPERVGGDKMQGDKPRELYIPPEPSNDENEIFGGGIASGINFDNYDKILTKVNGENAPPPIKTFEDSKLRDFLLINVTKSGYTKPTPIQRYGIPIIMAKRDLMACAQTGSGKTAAFLLPMLNIMLEEVRDVEVGKPQAVIMSPTRELAIQIFNEARKFALGSYLKICIVYGGTATRYQAETLNVSVSSFLCISL